MRVLMLSNGPHSTYMIGTYWKGNTTRENVVGRKCLSCASYELLFEDVGAKGEAQA